MAETYFDHREGKTKTVPNCARHGLMWNPYSQRCERQTGLGLVADEMLLLDGGGYDYGYYEPYYEPVYEPVYIEPAPAPIPEPIYIAPEPVYVAPEPVYQPIPEPVYQAPELVYYAPIEPIYYYDQAPYETPPYIPPIETVAYEPPVYIELAPTEYFALPVAPEPAPYIEPVYQPISEPAPYVEPTPVEQAYSLPWIPEPEPLPTPAPTPEPVYSDWAFCANENQRCDFPDMREVRYGKGSTWTAPQIFTGGVDCSNQVFGDPLYGTVKECQARAISQPAPEPIPEPIIASDFWSGELPTGEQIATPEWPAEPEPFVAPISEPVKMMAEDYYDSYGDAYLLNGGGGGGGYYDYGGGYYEPTYYEPIDYAPIDFAPYEPMPLEPPTYLELEPPPDSYYGLPYFEEVPLAPYEPMPLEPPVFEPITVGSDDLFLDYLSYYLGQGYDDNTAITLADQGAATGEAAPIVFETYTPYLPESPVLPDLPPLSFPYVPSPYDPWQTPPIIPPIEPIPPAPPAPQLPGYCPAGTYHPINDPFACVPFPPAPAPAPAPQQPPSQTPRPPTPSPAPRPPAQQQPQQQQPCPTGYCKHPQTGQCMPIPQGYIRHPQTQVCTAQTPQASPLPIPTEAEDMFADLKKLPWWVWAGLAGVVVLSRGGRR